MPPLERIEPPLFEVEGDRTVSRDAFDLPPQQQPDSREPDGCPFRTANYDRISFPCYDVGEYLSVFAKGGEVLAAWGENRKRLTSSSSGSRCRRASSPSLSTRPPDLPRRDRDL